MLTPPICNSDQLSEWLELWQLYLEVSYLQPNAEAVWENRTGKFSCVHQTVPGGTVMGDHLW